MNIDECKDLMQSTLQRVFSSGSEWMRFLTVAARFYKYTFTDQLLIYAQQPNASACADLHIWQDVMRRQIRCGAKGIALIADEEISLRYVYDVSETQPTERSCPVRIWQLNKRHIDAVAKMLRVQYGTTADRGIREQLLQAAEAATRKIRSVDYSRSSLFDIGRKIGYDDNEEIFFSRAVSASVGYILLGRCAMQPRAIFSAELFGEILRFGTPEKAYLLGTAVSTISEEILRQVEGTVKALERSAAYGKDDIRRTGRYLSERGGLLGAESQSPAAPKADREVRPDESTVPEGERQDVLRVPAGEDGTDRSPAGDRRGSEQPSGRADAEAGSGSGSDGAAQAERPAEMGRPDEQLQIAGGGDHLSGTDLRVNSDGQIQGAESKELSAPSDFRITDDNLGVGGAKAKFRANLNAIRLLKELESNHRQATASEQEILSRYVGWGGLADAFDPSKTGWKSEYEELCAALTPKEYATARASTLNAHYTPPTVIKALYRIVENFGFRKGNILEPACGVGNFFGCLPESMQGSQLYGVELDSLSARIAAQLYPTAEITAAGFETTSRHDFFDIAVGNVPFGQYQVNDPAFQKLGFSIHDYFFAKTLEQVRPGGIIAFLTSRYTMDKKSPEVRRYIAQRAELIGAIRLPNNTFRANAGTEVVSDMIFLQKRERPVEAEESWIYLDQTPEGFAVNHYFVEHPDMVLGKVTAESTQYGKQDYTVVPLDGMELAEQLDEAGRKIAGSYEALAAEAAESVIQEPEPVIPADPRIRPYSFGFFENYIYYRDENAMRLIAPDDANAGRIRGMAELRDCVRELLDAQLNDASDQQIEALQAKLNSDYDRFVKHYGTINSRANERAFSEDSGYYLLASLENVDENRNVTGKADVFTKRTIRRAQTVQAVDTASEALAVSVAEKACVDMAYMADLTGRSQAELEKELQGVIFRDVRCAEEASEIPKAFVDLQAMPFVIAEEYLSGDVRRKLRMVKALAEAVPELQPELAGNIEALQEAQPKDLTAAEIDARLGATWIDKEYIQQFLVELLSPPIWLRSSIQVQYSAFTAEWNISGKSAVSQNDVAAYSTYGTQRANAYRILEDSLNLRDVRVYDTVIDAEGKEKRVLNSKETTLAQQKQQALREAFQNWIWKDPVRRQTLTEKYNREFNALRPREYRGDHITFGGMNPEITLQAHQKNAIAHILYGGNTLLAHEVGSGKTFEMAAAAMESKRLGLCRKSLFVVPNHLVSQWASEFLRLYPGANLLVARKKDFEPQNRKRYCARIATGDYDAVIMGHSQFERIPVSLERQQALLQNEIDEIETGIAELKYKRGENFTIKAMERSRKQLEVKLQKLLSQERKDDVVTFEQLGIDRLFVDEAHAYKNLFCYTKMRNVAGLGTSDAQKSSDMYMKCRYMDELTGGRGVIFATGTPVSNSMTELYTMMRYLQHDLLQARGWTHFDAWAAQFGEAVTAIELAPEGNGYRARTRFARFTNLPELMTHFRIAADVKTADQLHLPRPEAVYHNVVAQPTDEQKALVRSLSDRASKIHNKLVDPSVDNMLKITSDGRKIGLDQRLINPLLPDAPQSKVNQCVSNILQIWRENAEQRLTQLVFCDFSTPKAAAASNKTAREFNVYDDIRTKLIAAGVPAEEIAFIHDADTEAKKKLLFGKVRAGAVRILMGSTAKMGAGTNVQDRLIALHDLDAPWRPGDLEQRAGRIIRQGNQNKVVHIFRYVTEATFDAYLWQTLEHKQRFISQIMTSKAPVRSCEDVDEAALSFAEIKALCAGDPRIKEKMDLDIEVSRLRLMKADYLNQHYYLEDSLLRTYPEQLAVLNNALQNLQTDLRTLSEHPQPADGFAGIELQGKLYMDKTKAAETLLQALGQILGEGKSLGSYRGFALHANFDPAEKQVYVTLKGAISHNAIMGTDARGNLLRMDHALERIPNKIAEMLARAENVHQQMEAARLELEKPFPQEAALSQKSSRLAELNAILDLSDAQENAAPERETPEYEP